MLRSIQSSLYLILPFALLPVMFGCSRSAESLEKLQSQILEDIVKQGGNSLKSVVCSTKEDEKLPQCLGVLISGSGVDIEVKQKEDQSYEWNIPSIKGLLNMLQVQTLIQDELRQDMGDTTLNCGGDQKYKEAKPGDTFDCQLTITKPVTIAPKPSAKDTKADSAAKSLDGTDSKDKTPSKPATPPAKIAITILPSGDVNWQKVVPEDQKTIKPGNDEISKAKPNNEQAKNEPKDPQSQSPEASTDTKTPPQTEPNPASPAAAKSADDFLNQSGATDDFE
jgi:hypothetical protein